MSTSLYSLPLFFIILHFTAISCAETPWELLDIGSAVVLASPLKDSKYNLPHSYNRFLETLMRVFAFFPFSPLDSSKHTIALPQKTMTPVTPIPSYCPPKNRAVIIIRLSQYSKPANKQPISLRLLIIKQVAFESIADVIRRMIMMPYPTLPHSTFSVLTSLARSADRITVVARPMHNPVARPAGMDRARPVLIWFRITRPSPFPSFYSGYKQKYRDRFEPVPVSVEVL